MMHYGRAKEGLCMIHGLTGFVAGNCVACFLFKQENAQEKITTEGTDTPYIDQIRAEINRKLDSQTQKGLEKYGKTIDPFDNYDWVDMAIEEATDMLVYLHALKIRMQKTAD